ncbi:GNAT family N-acetyltransferase [Novosphingobium olei]|uniref:GNAT family N-acetyltransferase n=1 Tax=Novosphingobium olei TaxID=2728851 RepID=UPI00308786A8|nr:GNAT family N-acetyltransferase [Novosphingobium olei]
MIETPRLLLRPWREGDVTPFHAICADPVVMATLGPVMSLAETQALVERCMAMQAQDGHCFWAMERREDARLIGWCGVIRGTAGPVAGKAEIGWRLASDCWGHGYASEAARATVDWVFANLRDDAAWAITHVGNTRSRAVMERLGMAYQPGLDFDHPRLAADDPLLRHVTYRLDRPERHGGAAQG